MIGDGGPFVGRSEELQALRAALLGARTGQLGVVVIRGQAGEGKTALVHTFLATADVGRSVVSVGCVEDEEHLPFGMFGQLVAALDVDGVRPTGRVEADPFTAGAVLLDLLGQHDGLVVVVVEDAQWADPLSLRALAFALRRIPYDRVLVVVTARLVVAHDHLEPLTAMATTSGSVLTLGGLGLEDVRALAQALGVGALSDRSLHRLLEHTTGNARYVRMLLEQASVHDPRAVVPPTSKPIEDRVVDRFAGLTGVAAALASAAAILGTDSLLIDVARLADLSGDDLDEAVDEVASSHLLLARDDVLGQRLAFTHPVVRHAIYHHLPAATRSRLHRRAAELSEDERLALRHEVEATIGEDAALAERVGARGAVDEAAGAWDSAAAWFLSAAGLRATRAEREGDVLRSALCLVVAGDLPAASSLMATATDFGDSALLRFLRGRMAALAGDLPTGLAELARAWEGKDDDAVALMAASHLSAVMFAIGRSDDAVMWAGRALDLDHQGGASVDIDALSRFLIASGVAGRAVEGIAFVEANPQRFATPGSDEVDGLLGRGALHHVVGAPEAALADLERVVEISRRLGPFHLWCYAQGWHSAATYQAGRWDDAVRHAMAATSAEDTEAWSFAVMGYAALSVPLVGRGDDEAAAESIATARALAQRAGNPELLRVIVDASDAWRALVQGDNEAAIDLCAPWLATPSSGLDALSAPPPMRTFGLASLRIKDHDAAARAAEVLDRQPTPAGPAWAAVLRLGVAAATEGPDVAMARYEEALAVVGAVSAPFEWAQMLIELGAFRRREGSRRAAVAHLEEARLALTLLGASPFVARCDSELARSGLKPRSRTNVASALTPTERIVAAMVRKGRTNRQIATELVVSVKTVEYHLSNLYRKLHVSNRTGLIQAMDDA